MKILRPRFLSFAASALLLATAACQSASPHGGQTRGDLRFPAGWSLRAQAVEAPHGMVVSGHPLASEAGVEVLQDGGNAIDAAVAVGFALAVVLPEAGNLGGGGFLIYRDAQAQVSTLDYRETAPGRASHDMYLDESGAATDASLEGHLAVGVPGSVAGLWEMHQKAGSLPWARLLEPAVELAGGHTVDAVRAAHLEAAANRLRRFPASRSQFLRHGEALSEGTRWSQPDLEKTLRQIATGGARAFYRGPIADLIAAEMERGGGILDRADLAGYQPVWRRPVEIGYRGYRLYSMPPPSSGGVTLGQILNVLEGYDPLPPFGSDRLIHLEAEAMRLAFLDRARYLGDPDFVDMPLGRLLSQDYADSLQARIHPRRAGVTPSFAEPAPEGTQTTHYSIVDAAGRAVAVTTTLNSSYGSGVTVTGAGFLLNNQMDDFAAAPGQPNQFGLVQGEANSIAPGKRMLSSMAPSLVLAPGGELYLVVGTPGGSTIISSVYHVISNLIDHGMTLAEAVAAPRVHHQAWPDELFYEPRGLDPEALARLQEHGHRVRERDGMSGDIAAIQPTAEGWIGVADPRRGGGAAGY